MQVSKHKNSPEDHILWVDSKSNSNIQKTHSENNKITGTAVKNLINNNDSTTKINEKKIKLTKNEYLDTLDNVLNNNVSDDKKLDKSELKVVCSRLNRFAHECRISKEEMYTRISEGKRLAELIESGIPQGQFDTENLVNFEWFLRAQHAKSNDLYGKGAMKIPDPDNKILSFMLNAQGNFHNKTVPPYERLSSHWPEKQNEIKNQKPRKLSNGEYLCFKKSQVKELVKKGIPESKIHCYTKAAIGIDATKQGAAGAESNTFLLMAFEEETMDNKKVPVLALKSESNSAVSVSNFGYGNITDRTIDLFNHGLAFLEKKGPKAFRSDAEAGVFPDRKEDKLPKDLLAKLKIIPLNNYPECQSTFETLNKTLGGGSDYGIPELKAHLENLQQAEIKNPRLTKSQKIYLDKALNQVNDIISKNLERQSHYEYVLPIRSNEVILPTLGEILAGEVKFQK